MTVTAPGWDTVAKPSEITRAVKGSERRRIILWMARLGLLAVLMVAWQLAYDHDLVNHVFIGSPSGIARYLYHNLLSGGSLRGSLEVTVVASLLAFLIGSLAGVLVGLLFVVSRTLEELVGPFLSALNALPRVALAPLFVLWLGIGTTPTILLGISLTFFAVFDNTVAGARSVDRDILTLCDTLGASTRQRFVRVVLPSSVPVVFAGLRLGLLYAILGVVTGEIIGAPNGLGQELNYLSQSFNSDGVYGILIVLMLIGWLAVWVMSVVERRLSRWR